MAVDTMASHIPHQVEAQFRVDMLMVALVSMHLQIYFYGHFQILNFLSLMMGRLMKQQLSLTGLLNKMSVLNILGIQ